MSLQINTANIPKWQSDTRLTNKDLKLVSQLVFSSLVTFIHDGSLKISCSMNELINDVRDTVNCHNQSIRNAFKVLMIDGVITKIR